MTDLSTLNTFSNDTLNLFGQFNNDIEIICNPNSLDEQEGERETFKIKFYTISIAILLLKRHDDSAC